jgi:hypothetical protein
MKELVPPEYQKSKDVEKLIYKEHSILQGTSDYDSKFRYVQLIRSLPTYGTSFFIVNVFIFLKRNLQKRKRKLRLCCLE